MTDRSLSATILIVRAGSRRCALRVSDVLETMRPLPIAPVAKIPGYILGLSVIRNAPTPVVDLTRLVMGDGEEATEDIARFVTLRVEKRQLALAVQEVLFLRTVESAILEGMPPLLRETDSVWDALGILDAGLLLLLGAARVIPEPTWIELEKSGK